jgi:hypothetical protein
MRRIPVKTAMEALHDRKTQSSATGMLTLCGEVDVSTDTKRMQDASRCLFSSRPFLLTSASRLPQSGREPKPTERPDSVSC